MKKCGALLSFIVLFSLIISNIPIPVSHSFPTLYYTWNYKTSDVVECLDISSDGQYIVVGSYDSYVYFFHQNSSTPLWSYKTGDVVKSVSISDDGQFIAVGSQDNNLYLFNKSGPTPMWNFSTGGVVWDVAMSSDGKYIAAGCGTKLYLFRYNC
ncbi:MAG: WD40 repeat domain-containing protein [Candidatus Helarchaeota archaeon]